MIKNVLLATVAATALIAGTSLALAQSVNTEQPKAAAPTKSVSEKPGQPARTSNKDADKARTTGQAPQADDAGKAKDRKAADDGKKAQAPKPQTTGQAPKADGNRKADDTKTAPRQTTGQAPREGQAQQPQAQPGPSGTQSGTQPGQPGQAGGGTRPEAQPGQPGSQSGTQGQAGQAGSGGQAQLSTEQRTQIRQTVMSVGNAPRVSNVAFSLSVGTVVPRSVKYAPLPSRVVEIYPAWRSYQFFIVGDQIVVVEPDSLRIVAVLPA